MLLNLSIVLNFVIAVLCAWGCVSKYYKDNFGERLGMSLIGMTCIVRAALAQEFRIEERSDIVLEIGILVFALSMFLAKVKLAKKIQLSEPSGG
jgi:hypothetical protein